jgi:DNA repair protein RecN (Recombination protein N)
VLTITHLHQVASRAKNQLSVSKQVVDDRTCTSVKELDKVPLLIFDEVDSGISGEVGNRIGEALRDLGKHHQVLVITHLHQVASRARNQLAVSKKEIDGRTFTSVKDLDAPGRIDEIVRMLGEKSDAVRKHAEELLENGK